MNKNFSGSVLVLDRNNINTDEIIPAKYLTYIEKEPLKKHLLEDLILDGCEPKNIPWSQYNVVLTRSNFGCGSSREMAVWAFEVNGISTIIASNFARIFRENAVNSGILPIELGEDSVNQVFSTFAGSPKLEVEINFESQVLNFTDSEKNLKLSFNLSRFDKAVVAQGGLVNFAVENY